MKTKYILHGGSAQHTNEDNDLFFKEILKSTPDKVKILLVHFAGTEDRKELNWQKDTAQFIRNKGNKEIEFQLAEEANFLEQIKNADVIYFGGGTTVNLINALTKFKNLKEALEGKIVAGESAGANTFCSYCYSKSGGGVIKCLGIVPVFMFPHYDTNIEADLGSVPQDIEKVFLPSYKFKTFEV
jgi:peptidase E